MGDMIKILILLHSNKTYHGFTILNISFETTAKTEFQTLFFFFFFAGSPMLFKFICFYKFIKSRNCI